MAVCSARHCLFIAICTKASLRVRLEAALNGVDLANSAEASLRAILLLPMQDQVLDQ
jgi:hypothetical protein